MAEPFQAQKVLPEEEIASEKTTPIGEVPAGANPNDQTTPRATDSDIPVSAQKLSCSQVLSCLCCLHCFIPCNMYILTSMY